MSPLNNSSDVEIKQTRRERERCVNMCEFGHRLRCGLVIFVVAGTHCTDRLCCSVFVVPDNATGNPFVFTCRPLHALSVLCPSHLFAFQQPRQRRNTTRACCLSPGRKAGKEATAGRKAERRNFMQMHFMSRVGHVVVTPSIFKTAHLNPTPAVSMTDTE